MKYFNGCINVKEYFYKLFCYTISLPIIELNSKLLLALIQGYTLS